MRSSVLPHASRSPSRGARRVAACMIGGSGKRNVAQRNCSMENGFTPRAAVIGFRPTKSSHGRATFMKRLSILAAGLLIGAAALQFSSVASGQGDGWVTLVDGTQMGDWTEVGKANTGMKDGARVAE